MVIGLVEPWACDVGRWSSPGDLLVAYSDGISEATARRPGARRRRPRTVAAFGRAAAGRSTPH
jgi:serine phosphatase RsbU (regulator of sigma subunit)